MTVRKHARVNNTRKKTQMVIDYRGLQRCFLTVLPDLLFPEGLGRMPVSLRCRTCFDHCSGPDLYQGMKIACIPSAERFGLEHLWPDLLVGETTRAVDGVVLAMSAPYVDC